jgi:uncharacterized protein
MLAEADHSEDSGIERIGHTFSMAFNPRLSETVLRLKCFEELPVLDVSRRWEGLIIDVDGTLTTPGNDEIPAEVLQKLAEIRKAMSVCIFGRDMWQLRKLGIPIVRNVAPKPDPTGFETAANLYLKTNRKSGMIIDPKNCAMVGDDFSTDGGCRITGMKFIHVEPRINAAREEEPFLKRVTRDTSEKIADAQEMIRKIKKRKKK